MTTHFNLSTLTRRANDHIHPTLAVHIETAFSEPAVIALPLQAQAKLLRKKITRRCFCCRWPMKRSKSRGSWAGL